MRLTDRVFGFLEVEVATAEPARLLNRCASCGIRCWDPHPEDPVRLLLFIPSHDWKKLQALVQRCGCVCTIRCRHGLLWSLRGLKKRPFFSVCMAFLLLFFLLAPGKIWFIRVEGNCEIPAKKILAAADACGVRFGAEIRSIRSEKIKNRMLNLIPELEWMGVNFHGGIATVSVRERTPKGTVRNSSAVTNIIAGQSGVITSMSVLGGQAICKLGQAVEKGELLVSGYIDCQTHTQVTRADAEIYAMTRYAMEAVYPAQWYVQQPTGCTLRTAWLLLGKQRIKIFGNSGISPGTCDKMTNMQWVSLPGGYILPVGFMIETASETKLEAIMIGAETARDAMEAYFQQTVLSSMIAGRILEEKTSLRESGTVYRMSGEFICSEMIARQRNAQIFEGDENK